MTTDLYRTVRVERYVVGDNTLTRTANLEVLQYGQAKNLEASIRPEDYPEPDHDNQRLVVACGMGVDSVAMLVEMHRRGIRPDAIQWADTGSERDHTYRYINVLQQWCKRVGFPPIVIVRRHCPKAGHRSLYEQMWNTQQVPSPAFHRNHSCSIEWKLKPQRNWQKQLGWLWTADYPILQAIGFEADEFGTRKGTRRVREAIGIEANEAKTRRSMRYAVDNDTDYEQWYPLVEWEMTREDCVRAIQDAGLPLPGKSACFMCPVSKLCELNAMADEEPENLQAAKDLEHRFQHGPGFRGKVRGLHSEISWSEWMESGAEEGVVPVGLKADPLPGLAIADEVSPLPVATPADRQQLLF